MALFGRKRTTVALDIGSGLIKLVVIDHGSGEPVLTKVAFTSVVDGAIVEGEVMDPGIVADALEQWLGPEGQETRQEQVRDGMQLFDGLGAQRVAQELWRLAQL